MLKVVLVCDFEVVKKKKKIFFPQKLRKNKPNYATMGHVNLHEVAANGKQ